MKSLMSLLLLSLVVIIPVAAQTAGSTADTSASSPVDRELIVWGGKSFSYIPQDFKEIWKNGWNAGLGYGISFAPGDLGYGAIDLVVEYNRFALSDAGYRSRLLEQGGGALTKSDTSFINNTGLTRRGTAKTFTAMLNFRGSFSSTKQGIAPYFVLGVGYIHYTSDSVALLGAPQYDVKNESGDTFSWQFGVGIEVPVTPTFTLFAEGRSVIGAFQDTKQYFPISGGIRYTFPR